MASSSRTTSIIPIAGAVAGVLAYVLYFDYKRRNDAEFRRKLRKDQKRVKKTAAHLKEEEDRATAEAAAASMGGITPEAIRATYERLAAEPTTFSLEEKEAKFMKYVKNGETLLADGPEAHLEAAAAFYQALRMYPFPLDLITIYEKTIPRPVFRLVIQLKNMNGSLASSDAFISGGGIDEDEVSPTRGGPPSEASSQEWNKITDPDSSLRP